MTKHSGPKCRTGVFMRRLGQADRDAVVAAMRSSYSTAKDLAHIVDTLSAANEWPPVGRSSVANHRRGDCKCQSLAG